MIKMLPHIRAALPLLVFVFCAGPPGCDSGLQKELVETRMLCEKVKKDYAVRHWDRRLQSIAEITSFLSRKDIKQVKLIASSGEFSLLVGLLVTATHDIHGAVRMEALKALSLITPAQAYARVSEMALNDGSDNVKWYALQVLSLYRDSRSAPVFVETLDDDDWVLRQAAIEGMLMLDQGFQRARLLSHIIRAIEDRNEGVSSAALSSLTLRDPSLYGAIAGVFRRKDNYSAKMLTAFMKALNGFILEKDIRKKVIACLSHQDKNVRILALRVLKKEKMLKKTAIPKAVQ